MYARDMVLGPILRGNLITLEPPQLEDLDTFRAWFAKPDVTRFLLVRLPPSREQEEEWYRKMADDHARVVWKIVAEGQAIGTTALHEIDWINRHATSGTIIGDNGQWGKGFGSEVVRLRTKFAFEELGLERLETHSMAENRRMHRCLEKSGYQKIATRRRYTYFENSWHDAFIFELLRDEWTARDA